MIYFLQTQDKGLIKIGFTNNKTAKRINQLNGQSPHNYKLLLFIEGDMAKERELHLKFDTNRVHQRREWFNECTEILTFIDQNKCHHIEPEIQEKKTRRLNKTNPIGVRFNKELLDKLSVTPQKALNIYEKSYQEKDIEPEIKEPPPVEEEKPDERDLILQQIAEIKKETIPKERDTPTGQKVWQMDKQKRIDQLLNKIL